MGKEIESPDQIFVRRRKAGRKDGEKLVAGLVEYMKLEMKGGKIKATAGDVMRLSQVCLERGKEQIRAVRVTWADS